jgi:hypothetical protein
LRFISRRVVVEAPWKSRGQPVALHGHLVLNDADPELQASLDLMSLIAPAALQARGDGAVNCRRALRSAP